jgi:hypothetical protein
VPEFEVVLFVDAPPPTLNGSALASGANEMSAPEQATNNAVKANVLKILVVFFMTFPLL